MKPYDVACLGRVAVDFYAEQVGVPLYEAKSFAMYVGGSSGNVAIGAARLGLKSAMVSRVGREDLGEFVVRTLAAEGVETRAVARDPVRLTGLVVLGIQPPDRFPLIFFRENCADINLTETDLDPGVLDGSRALFVTGTALSREPSRAATRAAARRVKSAGGRLVLDLDWRATLWPEGPAGFAREVAAFVPECDLVVGTEDEFAAAAGALSGATALSATTYDGGAAHARDAAGALDTMRARTAAALVLKRGAHGAEVHDGDARFSSAGFPVQVLNLLGAGDGFASGLLLGWLSDWPWERTLAYANAVGAIVVTRHGCSVAIPTRAEVEAFLKQRGLSWEARSRSLSE